MAAQKLRQYLESHPVKVVMSYPIRNILFQPDLTGRLLKWPIDLDGYGLMYEPQTTIKS